MARKKASKDGSFDIPQMERKLKITRKHKLTEKQQEILHTILDEKTNVVIINGPAGSSKTYLAIYAALRELDKGKMIFYLRSIVESSNKKIGFLPGDVFEKFCPYMQPLEDKLNEFLPSDDVAYLRAHKLVEAGPINFLRGADWRDKIVVVDEAQNITTDELITVLTRANSGTKIILCGDLMQPDIADSGFEIISKLFDTKDSRNMGIFQFSFCEEDIVRSELVKFIVRKLKSRKIGL